MSPELHSRRSDRHIHNLPRFWSLAQPLPSMQMLSSYRENLFLPLTANAKSHLASGERGCSKHRLPMSAPSYSQWRHRLFDHYTHQSCQKGKERVGRVSKEFFFICTPEKVGTYLWITHEQHSYFSMKTN